MNFSRCRLIWQLCVYKYNDECSDLFFFGLHLFIRVIGKSGYCLTSWKFELMFLKPLLICFYEAKLSSMSWSIPCEWNCRSICSSDIYPYALVLHAYVFYFCICTLFLMYIFATQLLLLSTVRRYTLQYLCCSAAQQVKSSVLHWWFVVLLYLIPNHLVERGVRKQGGHAYFPFLCLGRDARDLHPSLGMLFMLQSNL